MKRFLLILASALLFAALAACTASPAPAEDTAAAPSAEPISLVSGGKTDFIIVRSDYAEKEETAAALALRKYLSACGLDVQITTDWEGNGAAEREILVGNVARTPEQGNTVNPYSLGMEGYAAYVSGQRVYLSGGSDAALMVAVETFLTEFFGFRGDHSQASPVTEVQIPADYSRIVRQEHAITDILASGRSLSEYTIVTERTGDSGDAAALLQSTLYRCAGIRPEIKREKTDAPMILFSAEKPKTEKSCEMRVDETGNLVIRTDLGGGFDFFITRFLKTVVEEGEGEIRLGADYSLVYNLAECVSYRDFGAVGDGKTNDMAAIIATHDFANRNGLPVKADAGATYYIGMTEKGATVKTDTDWTGASFIVDDSIVPTEHKDVALFHVVADTPSFSVAGKVTKLAAGADNIGFTLPERSLLHIQQRGKLQYIRYGAAANEGTDQRDMLIVNPDGSIDPATPVIWDYDNITAILVYPMADTPLTLTGGTFTTVANKSSIDESYYHRGILVTRSHVTVRDVKHYLTGEDETPHTPYTGFLGVNHCANLWVENCVFSGHRRYYRVLNGVSVGRGTYDISINHAVNITLVNCIQANDILDVNRWGIMGTNFCKNITLDGCSLSRFDAHQGVWGLTLRNSTLGHQCVSITGGGDLLVEGCTLYGSSLVNLRSDFGSTWQGDAVIRNCKWIPKQGKELTAAYTVFGGSNPETHDFGYTCCLPGNILIENLTVDDSKVGASFKGIYLLAPFNKAHTSESEEEKLTHKMVVPEKITVRGLTTVSGREIPLSQNPFMFRNVELVIE